MPPAARTNSIPLLAHLAQGGYPEFPSSRSITVRIVNSLPPSAVTANGNAVAYARFGGPQTWTYDGDDMAVVLQVGRPRSADGAAVGREHG